MILTVPNPVFGNVKANGAGFVVFSGDAVVDDVGSLKLKPVDGIVSVVLEVVVDVGILKLKPVDSVESVVPEVVVDVGSLKLKLVDGVESVVPGVVVVGFAKLNDGKEKVAVVVVVGGGVERIWVNGIVDWEDVSILFDESSDDRIGDGVSLLLFSNKRSKSWRASAS